MTDAMIAVTGLVKYHAGHRVLDGVDLSVRRGEVAAVIGPSGGGKSTLLRCINALEPFQGGTIRVEDVTLQPDTLPRSSAETRLALRRKVGMVFQQFNLFPHLSVIENVAIGPRLSLGWPMDKSAEQARRLLGRVGLADKLAARPEQLSGGQQQRVAIARALAVQPQAVLFDEPTSALDPRMAGEVLAVIADLARDGLTMIVVTHAMGFARQVAGTVHVMHAGRVAESGPPDQIFTAPATDVTRSFLAEFGTS
jgi:ABC-type polar amino acid transport system ATPase subunit